MTIRCLICNSSVVLSQEEAQAIALLIGLLDGFLKGIQGASSATPESTVASPLGHTLSMMIEGISGAASNWADTQDFAREHRKFHFMGYDRLCLRCGALFNDSPDVESPPDG
ncbi:TPA: hypothetical protein L5D50_000825 [Pseudomonas aeruginosa]|nr:hypothetical protein [Pseudomonas aeruginosa]HBO9142670.1 hypothetical protein [Pseudomonas aeruginosa]HBO9245752.1 hypothetical protein [Pseudomonas aeruginosa]HBO9315325.1 hypothetical protein [Pseudomonas aeruginosa]HBO9741879.1 hypothetical protein [Pseudomonas aeruginosa]